MSLSTIRAALAPCRLSITMLTSRRVAVEISGGSASAMALHTAPHPALCRGLQLVQTHPQRSLRQPALVIEHLIGCPAIEHGQPAALVADFQKPLGDRLSVAPPP